MTDGGAICGHANLHLIYGIRILGCDGKSLLNFASNDPLLQLMHYLQILEHHYCLKITESFEEILNKVIRPFKFGIWIYACCCYVLDCVGSQ